MFYHVKIYHMKCFTSTCWQEKFSKLCQIVRCQIVRFLNLGAKLSWCQIVCFQLLMPNCPFLNLGAKLSGSKLSGDKFSGDKLCYNRFDKYTKEL